MKSHADAIVLRSKFYRISCLERAIAAVKTHVQHGGSSMGASGIFLSLTEAQTLLEAARLGTAQIYLNPELLNCIQTERP